MQRYIKKVERRGLDSGIYLERHDITRTPNKLTPKGKAELEKFRQKYQNQSMMDEAQYIEEVVGPQFMLLRKKFNKDTYSWEKRAKECEQLQKKIAPLKTRKIELEKEIEQNQLELDTKKKDWAAVAESAAQLKKRVDLARFKDNKRRKIVYSKQRLVDQVVHCAPNASINLYGALEIDEPLDTVDIEEAKDSLAEAGVSQEMQGDDDEEDIQLGIGRIGEPQETPDSSGFRIKIKTVSRTCIVCGGPKKIKTRMRKACRHHWMCVEHDPVVARMLTACRRCDRSLRAWPTPKEVAQLEPVIDIDSCLLCCLAETRQ